MTTQRIGLIALMLCPLLAGCGASRQTRALREENKRLAEQSKAQLAELENLKVHSREIEDDLMAAEQELASIDDDFRLARQKIDNFRNERESLRGVPGIDGAPLGLKYELARLAERYEHLHFDPETGISKVDTDVLFDSGENEIKPAARRMLQDLAVVLRSHEAQQMKVMVVGHTDNRRISGRETRDRFPDNWHLSAARALAVAEVLRDEGIDGERLGIAGFSKHQPIAANTDEPFRQRNRRVEIFVVSPDVPVVGMTETLTNLY